MGGRNDKIKVAIIDEYYNKQKHEDFKIITGERQFQCSIYPNYESFYEKQSLKALSYIIIRQQRTTSKAWDNSALKKTKQNQQQLHYQFNLSKQKPSRRTVRQKLIDYIRRYSFQNLVIYVYVENLLDFKMPDYQAPYVTLVAQNLAVIKDHLMKRPQRQEPSIFKFKRLVKDLYRRVNVIVFLETNKSDIDEDQMTKTQKQQRKRELTVLQQNWQDLIASHKSKLQKMYMQVVFYCKTKEFDDSLMSNSSDFIIVSSSRMLKFMINKRQQFHLQNRLIYHGGQQEIDQLQRGQVWMINGESKHILESILSCSDILVDKTLMRPDQTIIYTISSYNRQQKEFISKTVRSHLHRKYISEGNSHWIDGMNIQIVNNIPELQQAIKKSVYSYLLTVNCGQKVMDHIKWQLKQSNLTYRVYIYQSSMKDKKEVLSEQQRLRNQIQGCLQKAKFLIKFQVGAIQTLCLYDMDQKEHQYFQSKMGLITVKIDKYEFKNNYCFSNRAKMVENYHIVCKVQTFDQLRRILISEQKTYFQDILIIIYDRRKAIRAFLLQSKEQERDKVVFIHYNIAKIKDYLSTIQVKSLKLSNFVKKSLPNYMLAVKSIRQMQIQPQQKSLKQVNQSKCSFEKISFASKVICKQKLLEQVFCDKEYYKNIIEDHVSFIHFHYNQQKQGYSPQLKWFSDQDQNSEGIHRSQQFIQKFGILWRVGYDIFKNNQHKAKAIQTLKEDIKRCLFKCKFYSLIDVTDEEFEYFYIKRLDLCKTYLDLQISVIYILSLPHNFHKVLNQIFCKTKSSYLTPKVFAGFIVTLLSSFCNFEDEVMTKVSLVLHLKDSDINKLKFKRQKSKQKYSKEQYFLRKGDILFNQSFMFCQKNTNIVQQNKKNHCFFIQFENIPTLSQTFIKNYLYIQRFSFYKECTDYLIAPFVQFKVEEVKLTKQGKYHVYLRAVSNRDNKFKTFKRLISGKDDVSDYQGFINQVFKANSISEGDFFECIKEELKIEHITSENLKKIHSLYKKAELINLNNEKNEMIKSIIDSLEYKNFKSALAKEKNLSAFNHIENKIKKQKITNVQCVSYFNQMLKLDKSLLWFNVSQFKLSVTELQSILTFLQRQKIGNKQTNDSWQYQKIKNYRDNIFKIYSHRKRELDCMPKVKLWKVYAVENEDFEKNQTIVCVKMVEDAGYQWNVDYLPNREQFYLQKAHSSSNKIFLANRIQNGYFSGKNTISNQSFKLYLSQSLSEISMKTIDNYVKHYVSSERNSKQESKRRKKHSKRLMNIVVKQPTMKRPSNLINLPSISVIKQSQENRRMISDGKQNRQNFPCYLKRNQTQQNIENYAKRLF